MAIFGYFDASQMQGFGWRDLRVGDYPKKVPKTLCCAGFVAEESRWQAFNKDWAQMLAGFGVSELHMKHYAHSTKEFESWRGDEDKRSRFLVRATEIIDAHLRASVVSGVSLEDYEYFNRWFQLEEQYGTPYAFVASAIVDEISKWRSASSSDEPIVCYFEKGDQGQGDLFRIRDDDGYPQFRTLSKAIADGEDRPAEQRKVMPFQAADFLAYESAKFANSFGLLATLEPESFEYWKPKEEDFRKSHLGLLRSGRPHVRRWAHGYLVSLLARKTPPRPFSS